SPLLLTLFLLLGLSPLGRGFGRFFARRRRLRFRLLRRFDFRHFNGRVRFLVFHRWERGCSFFTIPRWHWCWVRGLRRSSLFAMRRRFAQRLGRRSHRNRWLGSLLFSSLTLWRRRWYWRGRCRWCFCLGAPSALHWW